MRSILACLLAFCFMIICDDCNAFDQKKSHKVIEKFNQRDGASAYTVTANARYLHDIENYLNGIKTMVASFDQVAPSGEVAHGRFFLSRPGKLRWQYDPPNPTLIIVNGSRLIYYDVELKQATNVSSEDNLAAFLTRPKVEFKNDILVKAVEVKNNIIRIKMVNKNAPADGAVEMLFTRSPIMLKKIEVTDAAKQMTSVSLSEIKYGTEIDQNLFRLESPTKFRRK